MLHQTTIIGRIGKHAAAKFTTSGKPVTEFTVAVEEKKGETHWYNVAVWGEAGHDAAQRWRKGAIVAVTGKPANRAYLKDGEARLAEGVAVNSPWDVRIIVWAKDDGDQQHAPSAFDDHDLGPDYSAPGAPLPPLSPG